MYWVAAAVVVLPPAVVRPLVVVPFLEGLVDCSTSLTKLFVFFNSTL